MNKLTIIGNVCREPVVNTTQQGITVCSFSVAVNGRKNKDGSDNTQFFNVSAWRQLGENCSKFLAKGKKCAVVGPVTVREYAKKDGSKGFSLEVTADEVELLSPYENSGKSAQTAPKAAPQKTAQTAPTGYTEVDDDVPF